MGDRLYLEVFRDLSEVRGFFSTKHGAVEGSPYYREDVLNELGLANMQLVWPQQVHKDRIAVIAQKGDEPLHLPQTDGMITNVRGVLLTTVHADCLPVYLFDPVKKAIGLVHAGWRGSVCGIAPKAARLMEETYGSRPEELLAYIGPGISRCCFETGPEVLVEFEKKWPFAGAFAERQGEKYKLDLKGINRKQLETVGLAGKNITVSSHCTCCEPDTFCSYRREGGTYLRMGAGLGLTE